MKRRARSELPELATFFSSGSLVDAVLNMGMQAPIDVQVAGTNMKASYQTALDLAREIRKIRGVADVLHSAGPGLSPRCGWKSTACAPANWG